VAVRDVTRRAYDGWLLPGTGDVDGSLPEAWLQITKIDELLAQCDVIVLAVPLARGTRRLLDAARIGRMRPGAVLVNIGRGALVDQDAMIAALAQLIGRGGYAGIVLLTFLETIFPPLPSEVFMPMAGFVAAGGPLTLPGVIAAGTLGTLAGAWFWYALGRAIGLQRMRELAGRHGRWLTLHPADIDRGIAWFDRHGGPVMLFGRMVPGVRGVISIPAGIAHMPMSRFLLLSGLGNLIWTTLLMSAGYWLGADYGRVAGWLAPLSNLVIAALVATYLWRVATFKPR
jgi:membrane protein DedA with SNARE-associated domain